VTEQPPRRGRPRTAEVDQRILDAAAATLRELGPGAVHIDAVSSRSGVARTTIYRRYRDRGELLTATLAHVTDQGGPPVEGDVRDKIRLVLERVRDVIERGLGRGGVASVLTGADPEFTRALRTALAGHLEPLMQAMADDPALRPGLDPDAFVNLAFGAYLGELLRYGEERPDWLDRTVALLDRAASHQAVLERERGGGGP
jgi:AcrR family transcriptional regulator